MNQEREIVRPVKVLNYAGAFIALLIGSGFATGQEIMQYFVAWGYQGFLGAVVTFALLAYAGMSFISAGYHQKFKEPNDIYRYYCGHWLGTFYDYFSIFFIYLSFIVMIGGAGSTAQQHYGVSPTIGGILLAVCAVGTVIFGLNRIVDVIGNIGPVIVVIAIIVGIISIVTGLAHADQAELLVKEAVANKEIKVASNSWWLAAGSYVGFCMLWLAAFLGQVGAGAKSDKEGKLGAFGGAAGFSIAVILMYFGMLFYIKDLKGSEIPALVLAGHIHPVFATIFSVIIFCGIYTTAVPLLWSVVAKFAKEGTAKFRILTIVLGGIATVVGLLLSFSQLVNIVYVINGYVGILLLIIMIVRSVQWKRI